MGEPELPSAASLAHVDSLIICCPAHVFGWPQLTVSQALVGLGEAVAPDHPLPHLITHCGT